MKNLGIIIKVVAFLFVCSICLGAVDDLLRLEPDMEPNLTMKEFYDTDKDSVQMIVLGSSHTSMGFSPMECYKQTGITSFNLSTAKQPIEVSYFLLNEAVKRQTPEVVIYEISSLLYTQGEVKAERYRSILDSMPLSLNKIWMADSYSRHKDNFELFSIGEALSPIYYYHERWKEVNEEDFHYLASAGTHLKGQVIRTYIKEIDFDLEEYDKKLEKRVEKDSSKQPTISENNLNYFLKIKKVCDDNNIKLVLTNTPTDRWNSAKNKLICDLADEYNLDFVNMSLDDGLVIDYSTDMADGNHVNASGAVKTTNYLTDFIVEKYGIKSKGKHNQFEESIKYYDKYYNNILAYQMETDFDKYLTVLNGGKENLTIFICGKGEMTAGLNDNDKKQLKDLGCNALFEETDFSKSYIAVIDGGEMVFEKTGDSTISKKYKLNENSTASLSSNGDLEAPKASILVDNKQFAINGSGMNVVVYDKESRCVIDSVSFNTHYSQRKWWRNTDKALEKYMFKSYKIWAEENI